MLWGWEGSVLLSVLLGSAVSLLGLALLLRPAQRTLARPPGEQSEGYHRG